MAKKRTFIYTETRGSDHLRFHMTAAVIASVMFIFCSCADQNVQQAEASRVDRAHEPTEETYEADTGPREMTLSEGSQEVSPPEGSPHTSSMNTTKPVSPISRSLAAQKALEWLDSQVVSSASSNDGSLSLVDSYEDDARAGWIYDASLAVIAFAAVGELSKAQSLLNGLDYLQNDDGSWYFSYNPDNAVPYREKRYIGSMAWVIMATNFYEWETQDRSFVDMAHRGLKYIMRFRQENPQHKAFGAISMGPSNPHAFSVENNLGCYSAFMWRGKLEDNPQYLDLAEGIRDFILNVQWAETTMGPGHPFFKVGYQENSLYLDAQTWSVLAFWKGEGSDSKLKSALDWADEKLKVAGRLGQISDIVGFNESRGGGISVKVWAEGTEGMVSALHVLGRSEQAAEYHTQTLRYQDKSGGIPYSTENADAWPTTPAVASTVWFLLNELSPVPNPFQPSAGLSQP